MDDFESSKAQVAALTRQLLREGVTLAGQMGLMGMHRTDRRALALLDELGAEGQACPSVLADRLGLTRGAVTTVVDRLSAAGLVQRRPAPHDGRRTALVLTERARTLGAEHLHPWATRIAEASTHLSRRDAEIVRDYLLSVLDLAPSDASAAPQGEIQAHAQHV